MNRRFTEVGGARRNIHRGTAGAGTFGPWVDRSAGGLGGVGAIYIVSW